MGGEKLWHLHKEITGAYCYHKTIRYEKIHRKGMLFMEEKHLTIASVKAAYQSGEKTPTGLMQEIIEKAKKYSDKNIWIIEPDMERIRPYIEKLGKMDFGKKPLWGIPFAIKDNIDLAGTPTTAGCKAYTYVPEESATVVDRLIKAGAIPIGKTNLDQFATGLVGTRSPYGEVSNALKPELISGGSSSGSAVSVALGMACFSLGTDTAGSGRVPAALNHLTGFKPTCGAWPLKGVVPACASLDCVTVFADSVEEAMKVDEVVRGLDESDRWSKDVSRKEDKLPECIYLPEQEPEFYGPYDVQYKAAWDKTISFLKQTGCKVQRVDLSFYQKAALLLYGGPCVAERWCDLGDFVKAHSEAIFPVTREILMTGDRPDYTAAYLYDTMHELMEYKRRSRNLLKDAVMIFPTCAGTYTRDQVRRDPINTNSDMGKYTNHCNLLDMSAIAVPGIDAGEDFPFGITIFGLADAEHKIVAVAKKCRAYA